MHECCVCYIHSYSEHYSLDNTTVCLYYLRAKNNNFLVLSYTCSRNLLRDNLVYPEQIKRRTTNAHLWSNNKTTCSTGGTAGCCFRGNPAVLRNWFRGYRVRRNLVRMRAAHWACTVTILRIRKHSMTLYWRMREGKRDRKGKDGCVILRYPNYSR